MRRATLIVSCLWLGWAGASAEIREEVVLRAKRSVVNVEKSSAHGLNVEDRGRFYGTGFVVDDRRGIVATNRHVAGTSPAQIRVTFENGESAEARILHYDAFHDFAFLRVDAASLGFDLRALPLGDSFALREQDEVVMIGNNDAEEYSVKFGRVTNMVMDKGDRHSATFQTSFDRAGGSSGSPVIDAAGRVVGIHFKGSDTTSFEMRVEYIADALAQILAHGAVKRGEIGVELDQMNLSEARKHFALTEADAAQVAAARPGIKRVLFVDYIVPRSPAAGVLQPGDVILEVAGQTIGDDLYRFDKLVDAGIGRDIDIEVSRNGTRRTLHLPVLDAERHKVRRFALFAGGVLHDLTPELRREYEIEADGVFLSQADPGSPMSEFGYGTRSQRGSRVVLIERLNDTPTPDLASFVAAARELKTGDTIHVQLRNLRSSQRGSSVDWVTLDLKYSPLKLFRYDAERLDWSETED